MRYDVLVVGAGPAGSMAAGRIAARGHSVILLEEHRTIGKPMQCGGLVSPRLRELVDFPVDILNSVRGAHVHSPSGNDLVLSSDREKGIVIDRTRFDQQAASWAVEQGASLILGSRVTGVGVTEKEVRVSVSSGASYRSRLVIGADGPTSITARAAGLPKVKEVVSGYVTEVVGKPVDEHMVEIYTGRRMGKGFFSWVIPSGSDRLRIGSGVQNSRSTAMASLRHLISKSRYRKRFSGIEPLSIHGGAIPIGMRDRLFSERLMVIGDAAGLAKPISGGGVVTGIISSGIAADVAGRCLDQGRFSERKLAPYQGELLAVLGRELKRASKLRRAFMHLSDRELETLFSHLTRPRILEKINEKGDIDYPGRMAMELVRTSPGLLRYALRYLGAGIF